MKTKPKYYVTKMRENDKDNPMILLEAAKKFEVDIFFVQYKAKSFGTPQ